MFVVLGSTTAVLLIAAAFEYGKELAKLGNKEIQMSVVASYYTNDWTHGWVSMLEGFSIFVNSEMEETLDDALTLLSGDRSLMQIEIRQENRKLMGEPFTACFDPNLLVYFSRFTSIDFSQDLVESLCRLRAEKLPLRVFNHSYRVLL